MSNTNQFMALFLVSIAGSVVLVRQGRANLQY
jgi:hypothetical protein